MSVGLRRSRSSVGFAALASCLLTLVAACGGNGSTGGGTASTSSATASKCGLGNGKKASGDPITLGAIVTKQPGTDFTGITGMAQAYFSCVNDNGGINGRPIKYIAETEQTNPQQVAALASKLIDDDKVLAIVGSTSLVDCPVNHAFYEQKGFNVTKANGISAKDGDLETVPIADANAIALKLVQLAGDGGGVVINYTPPEGLKILQAAEQQGLINRVKWAWSTPGNDASVVQALGTAWNGKLGVNAELALVDSTGPDNELYQKITKQYAPSIPLGSFGQMGFVAADIITQTLLKLPADQLTQTGVNAAIRQIKDFKTDVLCKPWYFGDLPNHVPNNSDRTVVPQNHTFVQKEDCFDIAAIAGANPLDAVRQAEKAQGLNAG